MLMSRRQLMEKGVAAAFVATSGAMTAIPAAAQGALKVQGVDSISVDVRNQILPLLDPGDAEFPMTATLNRVIEFGASTYYVFEQYQERQGIGEPVVIRKPRNGDAVVLADFVGLPPDPVPAGIDDTKHIQLGLFALSATEVVPYEKRGPIPAAPTLVIDKKVFEGAKENIGMDSSHARGTNGGRLACAWAVNQVVNRSLKRPILAGPEGLATANLVKVLAAKHARVRELVPGAVVISPSVYSPRTNIGHVGLVGQNGLIYSNSSSEAKWKQNFTVDSWRAYYAGRKGLSVQFYRLDEIYFPEA